MSSTDKTTQSPQAKRQSLKSHIKTEAARRGQSADRLTRQFLYQQFLALVFSYPDKRWILKGGVSLMMRLPAARHSMDVDLVARTPLDRDEAINALRQAIKPRSRENLLVFTLSPGKDESEGSQVVKLKVVVTFAGREYGTFSIDLALEPHLVAEEVEQITPTPIVDVPWLPELPVIDVYPIADHVADKVCAMYEIHPVARVSTRYRDLVDLALIVATYELDAAPIARSLRSEEKRRQWLEALPGELEVPALAWRVGYRNAAAESPLPKELVRLEDALAYVGEFLNPLLDGTRTTGIWNQARGGWLD
ncbi:MAG: nucleotidyl transferase AbiEii/AbiGii toxin family protein [Pseudonocardiaceae bacterium]